MILDNVIDTTENCRYCLMCRHVCPVGHVTRKETLTPHGWGLTIASINRGMLDLNEESTGVLYSCADCGTCRANCVTDQPLPSAIAAMRERIVSRGLEPKVVKDVCSMLEQYGNPYEETAVNSPDGAGDTALFVGDDARYLDDETIPSVLKLLAAVGIKPALVGVGRNNGYLAASLGLHDVARTLISETHAELEALSASTLLVLSPGDYYAFGQMSDERLGMQLPPNIRMAEVSVLLAEHAAGGELRFRPQPGGPPFAYIDPTHSVRVMTRFEAPRDLLRAVKQRPLVELFWRRERAHPCGNVALQFTEPHISNHLTYARLGDAREKGAQVLFTEDPGTLFHLRKHAQRFGLEIRNLYTLLANQLADQ
jgi:Fe-S oxidoreductase